MVELQPPPTQMTRQAGSQWRRGSYNQHYHQLRCIPASQTHYQSVLQLTLCWYLQFPHSGNIFHKHVRISQSSDQAASPWNRPGCTAELCSLPDFLTHRLLLHFPQAGYCRQTYNTNILDITSLTTMTLYSLCIILQVEAVR